MQKWNEIDDVPLKSEDGQPLTYFGIFWLDEDNDVIH